MDGERGGRAGGAIEDAEEEVSLGIAWGGVGGRLEGFGDGDRARYLFTRDGESIRGSLNLGRLNQKSERG